VGSGEKTLTATESSAKLVGVNAGTVVAVKAVNDEGLEGRDWAYVTIEGSGKREAEQGIG
jgi:hypothetical protein